MLPGQSIPYSIMSTDATVYLIDQDDTARNHLAKLLARDRFIVVGHASLESFLSGLPARGRECVLVDSDSAHLSGGEFVRALKERGVSLPVLFLTSDSETEARKKARAYGASGLYGKPVDAGALLDAIEWAIETHTNKSS